MCKIYTLAEVNSKFKLNDKPFPFVVIYNQTLFNHVCISLITTGQGNIKRIEKINKAIKSKQLSWKGLELSKPHEFTGISDQSWLGG